MSPRDSKEIKEWRRRYSEEMMAQMRAERAERERREAAKLRVPPFYVTTFCNFAHRLSDGRPIGHECYVLDVKKLRLEAAGCMDEIEGSIVREPRRVVRGRAIKEYPKP